MLTLAKHTLLFALTALAEIVGCYLPWLVLKGLLGAGLALAGMAVIALQPQD